MFLILGSSSAALFMLLSVEKELSLLVSSKISEIGSLLWRYALVDDFL
jgi:hypothetical protein